MRGGIRILQTCGGRGKFFGEFYSDTIKILQKTPLPPSVNDDQFPKHVFFLFYVTALGTLPYIGNFVHIGGFVFGIFASLVFLPRSNFRRFQTMALYTCFKGVFALLLAALTIVFCIFFAFDKKSKFCSWCQYLDCVPYTEHFCPNMNSDGYANTGG